MSKVKIELIKPVKNCLACGLYLGRHGAGRRKYHTRCKKLKENTK